MADGMFGAPIGERAYLDSALRALQVGTQAQKTLGEIAMQPDEARLLRAKASLGEMQLKEEELWQGLLKVASTGQAPRGDFVGPAQTDPAAAEREQSLWSSAAPQQAAPVDPVKKLNNLADLAIGAGLTSKGMKILEQTSQIEQRRASEAASRSSAAVNALKLIRDEAENMAQFFGGAKSQEELDTANALYTFQTGRPSPFAQIPYDPQIIGQLNQRALSAKERFDLAEKSATHRETQAYRQERLDQMDTQNRLRQRRLENEETREDRLRKQGEQRAAEAAKRGERTRRVEPKREDEDEAGRLIQKDFPEANKIDATSYALARRSVATEAAALMQRNPAISRSQAVAQAYTQARQSGDFEFEAGVGAFGLRYGGKFSFAGGGRTAATALPPPVDNDLSKLRKDRYYFNAKGQVGRWDGKQMVPVTEQ